MKILSPLDALKEVEPLAEAGAGEFFCGVLNDEWYRDYPVISINRRPAGKGHFSSFDDFGAAVQKAHGCGIPVYFTLNEHYYTRDQYPLVQRYVEAALQAGADALIVSDFGLMEFVRSRGYRIPLHVSTGGAVFNWRAAAFYHELGAVNITLPRHLSLGEVEALVTRMPSLETTVFVLNSRCVNVDGLCTFQHGLSGKEIFPMFRNACMLPYRITVCRNDRAEILHDEAAALVERQRVCEKVHVDDHPCGACALHDFKRLGIGSLKIVGRGNLLDRKMKDVRYIKALMRCLEDERLSREEYFHAAQDLYKKTYSRECRPYMCYFPEVMV